MDMSIAALAEAIAAWFHTAGVWLGNLLLPSRVYQYAIIAGCLIAAWLLRRWLGARMYDWMRGLEGWPKWRLRLLVVVHRRLQLLIFTVLIWMSAGVVMQISRFPSRRFLLEMVGSIAFALLVIGFAVRLVRNKSLRHMIRWALWIWVVLYFIGLNQILMQALDAVAIEFGDFRLSALSLIKALIVTGLLFILARLGTQAAGERIRASQDVSPSMRVLLVKMLQIAAYSAAFFIGLKAIGFDLTGLAVLSGAIGVGLGFGLQKVVSNLVSGFIILLDKSIKPGDVISLGDTFGWIDTLGARYASVVTRDGKEYLIPNEDLITGQVVNWSHTNEFVRLDIFFGTSYHDDPHKVRKIAIEAAKTVGRVLPTRPPVCHITGFGDSSVDYILRFWITDPSDGLTNVRGNVYLALWDAFQENGISIPFPQREVRVLSDEAPAEPAPKAPPLD